MVVREFADVADEPLVVAAVGIGSYTIKHGDTFAINDHIIVFSLKTSLLKHHGAHRTECFGKGLANVIGEPEAAGYLVAAGAVNDRGTQGLSAGAGSGCKQRRY